MSLLDTILPWRTDEWEEGRELPEKEPTPDEPQTVREKVTLYEIKVFYTDERSEFMTFHKREGQNGVALYYTLEGIDAYPKTGRLGYEEMDAHRRYGRPTEVVLDNVFKIEPKGEREEVFEDTWHPEDDG